MTSQTQQWSRILAASPLLLVILLLRRVSALNTDGILLLSFKSNVISDPLGVLNGWSYGEVTPCSWYGVSCGGPATYDVYRHVTGLSLPNSQLLGSIPANLGMIPHLRNLDLSNNSINGSIPLSIFNATELRVLDLSNNIISGELSELIGGLRNLELLNLSDNALAGRIPENISSLPNLKTVSLKGNYFSGDVPTGSDSIQSMDLSANLINGSLPANFRGNSLRFLNMSFNRLSGEIPQEFANTIPSNAIIDLSSNNFSGEIPETTVFQNQLSSSFDGNPLLCGRPLTAPCSIASAMSKPSNNATEPTSPPAIAAIPNTIASTPADNPRGAADKTGSGRRNGLPVRTITAIVVGDVLGMLILAMIFIYIYKLRKKKGVNSTRRKEAARENDFHWASSSLEEYKWIRSWTCLRKTKSGGEEEESSSETTDSDDGEESRDGKSEQGNNQQKRGELVTVVEGEMKLELETLLKASAYILGASGSSIMYKAVMEDGKALAVRRIGDVGVERFRDFENQVRNIAKLVHPNLVRILGFYWGSDEKLVIYDFVPNGSLANARFRKVGSSPGCLPWEVRLKIARGVARGLTYVHDKKHVHGNLKPSNILLGADVEPKIGDFGLERLLTGETSYKAGGSARIFGSKRSTASRDGDQDLSSGPTPSPSPSSMGVSPYCAPESLRSLKPNPKWDVYSFGVVLLELLTGKVMVYDELAPGSLLGSATSCGVEDKGRVLRLVDMAIRADLEGKEEDLLVLLRLGYNCICPVPQKRPNMKEVLHALEKFPSSSFSNNIT